MSSGYSRRQADLALSRAALGLFFLVLLLAPAIDAQSQPRARRAHRARHLDQRSNTGAAVRRTAKRNASECTAVLPAAAAVPALAAATAAACMFASTACCTVIPRSPATPLLPPTAIVWLLLQQVGCLYIAVQQYFIPIQQPPQHTCTCSCCCPTHSPQLRCFLLPLHSSHCQQRGVQQRLWGATRALRTCRRLHPVRSTQAVMLLPRQSLSCAARAAGRQATCLTRRRRTAVRPACRKACCATHPSTCTHYFLS